MLDNWIREREEPTLSSDNLDWLNQDLPSNEGKKASHENDGRTSYRVSRRASSIAQGRDIGSSHKGKAPQIISSSSSSDDGEGRVNKGGSNIGGVGIQREENGTKIKKKINAKLHQDPSGLMKLNNESRKSISYLL